MQGAKSARSSKSSAQRGSASAFWWLFNVNSDPKFWKDEDGNMHLRNLSVNLAASEEASKSSSQERDWWSMYGLSLVLSELENRLSVLAFCSLSLLCLFSSGIPYRMLWTFCSWGTPIESLLHGPEIRVWRKGTRHSVMNLCSLAWQELDDILRKRLWMMQVRDHTVSSLFGSTLPKKEVTSGPQKSTWNRSQI